MRCLCFGLIVAVVAAAPMPALAATNVVGQAVQKLHLSPQQLLSLRDALGDFNRGTEIEASGDNVFVLRDAATMAYAGEFSLTLNPNGSLQLDRASGPARLDASHSLALPLRPAAKSRAQVVAALAGSELLAAAAENAENAAPRLGGLPDISLPALQLMEARAAGTLADTRAVFYRDGSGWVRTLRAPLVSAGTAPTAIRIADRYLPPIRSDGTHVWRDSTVEIDSDLPMRLSDLDNRYRCAPGTLCTVKGPSVTPSAVHFIRWGKQNIAAVPASLLAQLAPPPAPDSSPADAVSSVPPAPAPGEVVPPGEPDSH